MELILRVHQKSIEALRAETIENINLITGLDVLVRDLCFDWLAMRALIAELEPETVSLKAALARTQSSTLHAQCATPNPVTSEYDGHLQGRIETIQERQLHSIAEAEAAMANDPDMGSERE